MGRTRVSPEDSSFQVISHQSGGLDSDLSSSSNSSTIASTGSSQPQHQQQAEAGNNHNNEQTGRTIKIRFLEDLPAAEQQKYQDEQLKKQVERRAALNGHLAYLNQHKTTGDNAQNSENKKPDTTATTTAAVPSAATQQQQQQGQQQSADSKTTAVEQQPQSQEQQANSTAIVQQPKPELTADQQYGYNYSNSGTGYTSSQQQQHHYAQQQPPKQLSNGSVSSCQPPGYTRHQYPPQYSTAVAGYQNSGGHAKTTTAPVGYEGSYVAADGSTMAATLNSSQQAQLIAERNSYTRGADGYAYNDRSSGQPNGHIQQGLGPPPSYSSATAGNDYVDHMQATEARYERWRTEYHHAQRGPGRAYRRLPTGSAGVNGVNGWTRDPRIAEAAYRRFTVEQQIRYGILPPRDGTLLTAGVTVTSEHTVVEDRMYYRDSRFYESNGTISNGRVPSYQSYQLDASRLQDQDTAALLGQDQQPNGHVPALPKTPTICQQLTGHGNIPGVEGGEENVNYEYTNAPMAGLPMLGAIMGMCIGGPVGFLAGVKIGGLAAVGGSILGYTGASVVSEHREIRDYIDEHYASKPELYVQTPKEEAAAAKQRRSSRQLPELPGTGASRSLGGVAGSASSRPIGPAGLKPGPNGYRRPSLVRLSSQDRFVLARSSSVDQRAQLVKQNSVDGHRPRLLPQRPPLLRGGSSSELLRNYKSAAVSNAVQRRISFQRQSSTVSMNGGSRIGSGSSGGYYSGAGSYHHSSNNRRFVRQSSASDMVNHHSSAAAAVSNGGPPGHHSTRVLPNLRNFRRGYGDQPDMEKQSMMALIANGGGNQTPTTTQQHHSSTATANGTVVVANGGSNVNNEHKRLTQPGCDTSSNGVVSSLNNGGAGGGHHNSFWTSAAKRQSSNGYQRLDSTESRQSNRVHHRQPSVYRQASVQE